ncbi:hypothetical protein BYT27DRAFT_7343141 [Phlegmacium glaucopus]|nr:hypothetical protein BYT27DRAFT_7343141 [Phlegmacium glaucopus]
MALTKGNYGIEVDTSYTWHIILLRRLCSDEKILAPLYHFRYHLSDTAEQIEPMKGEISLATKALGETDGPYAVVRLKGYVASSCRGASGSNESDLASESCSEFDPPSPDSIFDESNIFGFSEKSHLDNPRPESTSILLRIHGLFAANRDYGLLEERFWSSEQGLRRRGEVQSIEDPWNPTAGQYYRAVVFSTMSASDPNQTSSQVQHESPVL